MRSVFILLVVWAELPGCTRDSSAPTAMESSTNTETQPLGIASNQDTYIRSNQPNATHGASGTLRVDGSGNNRALVAFDTAALAASLGSQTLVSATLELSIQSNGNGWGGEGRQIDVHRVTTAWTEASATWNCAIDGMPTNHVADCTATAAWAQGDPIIAPWVAGPSDTQLVRNGQGGVVAFDVTADVAAFLAGTANNGWIIKKNEENKSGRVEFSSREGMSPPRLSITGSTLPPPPPLPSTSAAVSAAADTYLRSGAPNRNQGLLSMLRLRAAGDNRSLIRFDQANLASTVGNRQLVTARLELTVALNKENWGPGRVVGLHRLLQAWTETAATWNCATDANPTNHKPDCLGDSGWAMATTSPYVPSPTATLTVTNQTSGILSINVTSDVQAFLSGAANNGWLLKKADEDAPGRIEFASRETPAGPRLVLELVIPEGTDTDGDGIAEGTDNCIVVPNPGQANADHDLLGDACDACPGDPTNNADGDGNCGPGGFAYVNLTEVVDLLPKDQDGNIPIMVVGEEVLKLKPRTPNPWIAHAACTSWVSQCIRATDRGPVGCASIVPLCTSAEPWNESPCCPAACIDAALKRFASSGDPWAARRLLAEPHPCFPGGLTDGTP